MGSALWMTWTLLVMFLIFTLHPEPMTLVRPTVIGAMAGLVVSVMLSMLKAKGR